MISFSGVAVAKQKKPVQAAVAPDALSLPTDLATLVKARQGIDREEVFQPQQLYRDLAVWISEVADMETKLLKRSGKLEGREAVTAGDLVDGLLRPVIWGRRWTLKSAEFGPDAQVPPAPKPFFLKQESSQE